MHIAITSFATVFGRANADLAVLYDQGDEQKALVKKFTGDDNRPIAGVRKLVDGSVMSEDEALMLLSYIADNLTEDIEQKTVVPIILMIIAVTRTGTVTEAWCNKFSAEIPDMRALLSTTITRATVRATWTLIGSLINDTNIEAVLDRWFRAIPGSMLRLSITIRQAAGKDLTALETIKTFVRDHPSFPFIKLMRLYPKDMTAAATAMQLVGNQRYYGYRKDPGAAKASNYRNLTWVAQYVLTLSDDHSSLRDYRGAPRKPDNMEVAERIIREYTSGRAAQLVLEGPHQTHEKDLTDLLVKWSTYGGDTDEPREAP